MRSLIIGLAAVATLAGLPATASATGSTGAAGYAVSTTARATAGTGGATLPTCSGRRLYHQELRTREGLKAAYIHVYYNTRTRTACAYLNSTNATWGTRKHMTIVLKHCASPSDAYYSCNGQLQQSARRGWYSGRTDTARLNVSRGCLMAIGRIYWGKHYGLTATQSNECVNLVRG
jgi:hypothetical protein